MGRSEGPIGDVKQFLLRRKGAPLALLLAALGVGGLRALGLLQGLEWWAYDWFLRAQRQSTARSERVVVIGITESDLREYRFPVDDATLARALEIVLAQPPRAIGVDLFRDLPVPPGHGELSAVLQSSPTVVGITFVGGEEDNPIGPPPMLPQERVAASDLIGDGDGTIRRTQLYPDRDIPAIGLKLASMYLAAEGIEAQASSKGWLQFSDLEIIPLKRNSGSYVRAQVQGYQILLPYQSEDCCETITLKETLEESFAPDFFRDRIVLIGTVAASARNEYLTPYSRNLKETSPRLFPGVSIHAQLSAGILETVLGDKKLIKPIPEFLEYLWILGICGLQGAVLVCFCDRGLGPMLALFGGTTIALSFTTFGIAYYALILGWWLPVVPPVLALAAMAVVGIIANSILRALDYQALLRNRLVLQEPEAQLGRLAGALDHEIRSALQYILNGAQFMQAILSKPEEGYEISPEVASLIHQNLNSIDANVLAIVETLQALLRPDPRDLISANTTIAKLNQIIGYYFRTEHQFAPACELRLDPALDAPTVPLYISPAIVNILRNAYEALQETPDPQLTVATTRRRDAIVIEIADNGPGIPPQERQRIFDLYTSSKGGQHGGIGLHLAKILVERAGGTLSVAPSQAGGCLFLIELSLRKSE